MAATDAVQPLTDTPERPQIDLTATLGEGDSLSRALERAGVGGGESARVATMLSDVVDPDDVTPGTALSITLGRRASKNDARPLQALALRARFDMRVEFERIGTALNMRRIPIAIDRTPLRVDGIGPLDEQHASVREGVANSVRLLLHQVVGVGTLADIQSRQRARRRGGQGHGFC